MVNTYTQTTCDNILTLLGLKGKIDVVLVEGESKVNPALLGYCWSDKIELYHCEKLWQGGQGHSRTLLHEIAHLKHYGKPNSEDRAEAFSKRLIRFCARHTKVY